MPGLFVGREARPDLSGRAPKAPSHTCVPIVLDYSLAGPAPPGPSTSGATDAAAFAEASAVADAMADRFGGPKRSALQRSRSQGTLVTILQQRWTCRRHGKGGVTPRLTGPRHPCLRCLCRLEACTTVPPLPASRFGPAPPNICAMLAKGCGAVVAERRYPFQSTGSSITYSQQRCRENCCQLLRFNP